MFRLARYALLGVFGAVSFAMAALAAPEQFDLPSQPLMTSLNQVAHESGLSVAVDSKLVAGRTAPALHGSYEPAEALSRLLAGSGLQMKLSSNTAVITGPSVGGINLGPVRVQGIGPNGSTDVTATEGTGSYTSDLASIGSKIPMPMKETPQSISVLTQQRMKDQNLYTLSDALNQMTGVTVLPGEFISRGFDITNFQIDGGAPFNYQTTDASGALSTDLAEYDHIELIRGSDGLFTGTGDPSGTVNLVRKRPLDHEQVNFDFSGGSWDNFREQLDATGPIAFDGKLRGRIIFANQDQNYFVDSSNSHQKMIYATLEADLTPTTLLTVGGHYEWSRTQNGVPGLPRYENGDAIPYSTSECLCYPWEHSYNHDSEAFIKLDQKLGDNWTAEASLTTTGYGTDGLGAYLLNFGRSTLVVASTSTSAERRYLADAHISGKFYLFGQPQQLTVGGDYARDTNWITAPNYTWQDGSVSSGYLTFGLSSYPFDPNGIAAPARAPGASIYESVYLKQFSMYSMVRLQPIRFLHLLGGFRLSGYDTHGYSGGSTESMSSFGSVKEGGVFTPYGAVTLDLTKNWSSYFSYASIYTSQISNLSGPYPGMPLPPTRGNTLELGVKGSPNDGRLNITAAVYKTHKENVSESDDRYASFTIGQTSCCYLPTGTVLSEGFDLEATGEVLPDWQIYAGYTYNFNQSQYGNAYHGTLYKSEAPKHLFKLWTTYNLPGKLSKLSVGGGVNFQSGIYASGSVGTVYSNGTFNCPCVAYRFTQGAYAIVSLRAAYQFTPYLLGAINVDNIADKKYFQETGTAMDGNYYGTPRSFMFTLHATY